eukprot:scaffold48_cov161-Amphora_coffeaeformis.AAC.10
MMVVSEADFRRTEREAMIHFVYWMAWGEERRRGPRSMINSRAGESLSTRKCPKHAASKKCGSTHASRSCGCHASYGIHKCDQMHNRPSALVGASHFSGQVLAAIKTFPRAFRCTVHQQTTKSKQHSFYRKLFEKSLSTLHLYFTGPAHSYHSFTKPLIMNGSTNGFKFEPLDEETLHSGAEG